MASPKRKTTEFTEDGLTRIRDDKPVVYKIRNAKGENIYTGSAKRGRVEDRLREHLPGGKDPVPGAAVSARCRDFTRRFVGDWSINWRTTQELTNTTPETSSWRLRWVIAPVLAEVWCLPARRSAMGIPDG